MSDSNSDVLLISAAQASHMLSVSERLVCAMAKAGELPCVRMGRRVLFDPADLRAWVAARKTRGADSAERVG